LGIIDGSIVPAAEIEAAADALRILWESPENQHALKETGCGANWLWQARLALEAALAVRGRSVQTHDTAQ
jgi:hypothetical protein